MPIESRHAHRGPPRQRCRIRNTIRKTEVGNVWSELWKSQLWKCGSRNTRNCLWCVVWKSELWKMCMCVLIWPVCPPQNGSFLDFTTFLSRKAVTLTTVLVFTVAHWRDLFYVRCADALRPRTTLLRSYTYAACPARALTCHDSTPARRATSRAVELHE